MPSVSLAGPGCDAFLIPKVGRSHVASSLDSRHVTIFHHHARVGSLECLESRAGNAVSCRSSEVEESLRQQSDEPTELSRSACRCLENEGYWRDERPTVEDKQRVQSGSRPSAEADQKRKQADRLSRHVKA